MTSLSFFQVVVRDRKEKKSYFIISFVQIIVFLISYSSLQLRELPKHSTASGYPKLLYSKAEAKAAKSLSIIVILFAVSWIPLYTMNAVIYFCPDCFIPEYLVKCLILLSHANSLWNPGLYAWGLADFRAVLRKMFLFRKKKYNGGTHAQQTMLMSTFNRTDLL